ncbi:unnamed protein product [Choristocarpus tenellus]
MQIATKVFDGERPCIPSDTPPVYQNLIQKCWAPRPQDRLTFSDIVEMLDEAPKSTC